MSKIVPLKIRKSLIHESDRKKLEKKSAARSAAQEKAHAILLAEKYLRDHSPGSLRGQTERIADQMGSIDTVNVQHTDAPVMPIRVSDLHSDEIGNLHAHFVAYGQYLDAAVAAAELDDLEAQSRLLDVEAYVRLTKNGTIPDRNNLTRVSQGFREANEDALKTEALAKLLRARAKGIEKCAGALSRELTRRQDTTRRNI